VEQLVKLDPGPLNRRRAPLSQHGDALTTIQYPKIRRRLMPVAASAAHRVAAVQRVLTEDRYGQLKPTGTIGSDARPFGHDRPFDRLKRFRARVWHRT